MSKNILTRLICIFRKYAIWYWICDIAFRQENDKPNLTIQIHYALNLYFPLDFQLYSLLCIAKFKNILIHPDMQNKNYAVQLCSTYSRSVDGNSLIIKIHRKTCMSINTGSTTSNTSCCWEWVLTTFCNQEMTPPCKKKKKRKKFHCPHEHGGGFDKFTICNLPWKSCIFRRWNHSVYTGLLS